MCKTVEDYAKEKILEERQNAIRKMLQNGLPREMILSLDYSEAELEAVEKELLTRM